MGLIRKTMKCFAAFVLFIASAAAISRFDDCLWDMEAKMQIYNEWNPGATRTADNFNPFEKNPDGNSCDPNGKFPGELAYKDPQRPDVNFASMNAEREALEKVRASPKPGDVEGAPGRWRFEWYK